MLLSFAGMVREVFNKKYKPTIPGRSLKVSVHCGLLFLSDGPRKFLDKASFNRDARTRLGTDARNNLLLLGVN